MRIKKILLSFLFLGGIFFSQSVLAEGGMALGISPAVFEITANQGEVIENIIRVNNPTDNIVNIKMTAEDIEPSGEQGNVIVKNPGTESYSIASWIKCDPETFQLNPREERKVKFTITVPQNAEPGGHYGTVVAGPNVVASSSVTGAAIVPRVGAVILINLPGEKKEQIIVKDFYTQVKENGDRPSFFKTNFFQYPPVGFAAKFENKGTVHIKPGASIVITNWFGQKVDQIELPAQNVLPNATRIISTEWNGSSFNFGRYTATLAGAFGTYNTPLSSSNIIFWIFPIKEILIALAIIIFFIFTRKRWWTALKIILTGKK
ncbi:MAG: hypothetical protein WC322_00825 [Candidatus Paceibacterota bacterium]|jgi:hypothetical protein|nr:hypothetical protein [Candidatus Paceibacterota bacterium]